MKIEIRRWPKKAKKRGGGDLHYIVFLKYVPDCERVRHWEDSRFMICELTGMKFYADGE